MRAQNLLAIAVIALPVAANAFDIDLRNQSDLNVTGISFYPLGTDGEALEDNLGGAYALLAPGAETRFSLSADCAPMLAVVSTETSDDLHLKIDTCTDKTIIVRD